MNAQIIGRRKMIKNLVLGSGLMLYPSLVFNNNHERLVHLITVGTPSTSFVKEFAISNPHIDYTGIGNSEGSSFIEYDFSFINMQIKKFDYGLVKIPENIKDVFNVQNKYILICVLMKPYLLLSNSIIKYLHSNSIDFHFLGITPFFNPALGRWGMNFINKLLDDSILTFFDVNDYFTQINNQIPAVDAFEMLDDELMDVMIKLINI